MRKIIFTLVCIGLAGLTSSTHHHKKKYPYFYNRAPLVGLEGGLPLGVGGLGGRPPLAGLGLGGLGLGGLGFQPGFGGFPFRPNTGLGNSVEVTSNKDPINTSTPEAVSPSEPEGTVHAATQTANPQSLTPIFIPISPNIANLDEPYFVGSDEYEEAQDRQGTKRKPVKVQRPAVPGKILLIPNGAFKRTGIKPGKNGLKPAITLPGKQIALPGQNTNLVLVIPTFGLGGNANNNNNGQFNTQAQFGTQNPTTPNLVVSIPQNQNQNQNGFISLLQQLLNQQVIFSIIPGQQQQQQQQQQQNTGSRKPPIYLTPNSPIYDPTVSGSENPPITVTDPHVSVEEEPLGQSVIVEEADANSEPEDDYNVPDNARWQKNVVESRNEPEEAETPSQTEEPQAAETPETQDVQEPQEVNELSSGQEGEVQPPSDVETRDEPDSIQVVEAQGPQDFREPSLDLQAELLKNYAKIAAQAQELANGSPNPEPTTTQPPAV